MKDLEGKKHLVGSLPLFRSLSRKEIHWVADLVQILEAKREDQLFRKGDTNQSLFLILHGSVKIYNPSKNGEKEEEVQILKKGEYFGIQSLLTGESHGHSAKALTDSRFLVLSQESFQEMLQKIPFLSVTFSKMLTKTLRNELLGSKEYFRNSVVCFIHEKNSQPDFVLQLAEQIFQQSRKKVVILRFNQPLLGSIGKSDFVKQFRFQDNSRIKETLGRHYPTHSFIFLEVFPEDPEDLIQSLIEESDNIEYLFSGTSSTDLKSSFLKRFVSDETKNNDQLFHETNLEFLSSEPKLQKHLIRKARELSGIQVGIALGGGAALGLAQIGIMKVFEEEGLFVDCISGTSIGAVIGAFWASGLGYKGIRPLLEEIDSIFKMLKLVDFSFPGQGLLHGKNVRALLEKYIGDIQFEDCLSKLRLVSCDISTRKEVILSKGRVLDAIMASVSIPGVFIPQPQEDGRIFVDGGIVNPLPVSALTSEGVERIIAVNSMPSSRDTMKTNKILNLNVLDIIVNSLYSLQYRIGKYSAQDADVYLNPILPNSNWFEFWRNQEFIEYGEKVAREALPEIYKLYKIED